MKVFIKKHEYNYIKKCLYDLDNALKYCVDLNVNEATKAYIQNKILGLFTDLSEEEKEILNITKLTDPSHIPKYLTDLNEYVYGIPNVSNVQISKLFKKEKKLKLPDLDAQDSKNVYLGWIDTAIRKILIVYNLNGKFVGMSCRLPSSSSSNTNICTLCNHMGPENEIAFVSPICKTSNSSMYAYKSIGFHVCLDSKECNDRIVSTEKLEKLLKDVNNIK